MNSYRSKDRGQGPQQFRGCGCGRPNYQNNNGTYQYQYYTHDAVAIYGRPNYQNNNGTYQYQYYTHDPQSEQYGPSCNLCGKFNHSPKHCYKEEHDINNIMEKMSINPHQSQQNNLYQ